MSMVGKTKDTLKSRYDLVHLGIRKSLHPIEDGDNIFLPAACYTLSPEEKLKLCNFLANLKVPDAFSSNISREYMRQIEVEGSTHARSVHKNRFIDWFRARSEQVFYLNDLVNKDWFIIAKTNPRDLFNVPEVEREVSLNDKVYQQDKVEDILCGNNQETDIEVSLHRDDVEAKAILRTNVQVNEEDGFINDNDTDISANEESEEEFLDDNDGEDISHINKRKERGKYKSKTVDYKIKHGGKIKIMIPDDIDRAVGSGARDIVNFSGWIMRTTISFRDGNWQKIVLMHGEVMWLRVRVITLNIVFSLYFMFYLYAFRISNILLHCMQDKFKVQNGLSEHKLQGFVISTMQRLFRSWKARLHVIYSSYDNDKNLLSHRPEDVELDDWNHLVEYFGSDEFKGQLHQLVVEQQSEEIENPMTSDEILSSVLGVRSGYVRGKGHGKKPPKKSQMHQENIEASVSLVVESMCQEIQLDMER
ncbi:putative formin-like protein 3-like [Capsicum annuum]|nr:putative formin-like protein 3-like [Capsicum annuum]KAF3657967.1 putative formin-like protein 3-like [Capsicum annuum]